jgi:hypothetical protein
MYGIIEQTRKKKENMCRKWEEERREDEKKIQ